MRNNRKQKLKISSSNVKNFPKDFFTEASQNEFISTPKRSEFKFHENLNETQLKLRPCSFEYNISRICSPKVCLNESGAQKNKMFTIQNPDPLIYIEEAEVKLDRRSKGKSLSLQRNFNSEPSPNGFRRQIKLKDSFQNIESAPHPNIYSHEETSRRSKSIVKKPFLNQRNIPQIMTSRHKNIYSANAYILSSNLQLQNQSLESSRRPEERFSDSKLLAFKNKAIILERRNKQFIRPFCLGPQNNLTIKTKLNNTMKKSKLEDFTLPDIFKDSIQPSTDGTENSFIECQHLSFDSDEECEPVQSAFLTKLEKTINKQPAGSNQGKELVSHSFGLDKI